MAESKYPKFKRTKHAGKIAESSDGTKGIIYYFEEYKPGKTRFAGRTLQGHKWGSRNPKIISHSIDQYVHDLIEKEVSAEKKAYLDAVRRTSKKHPSEPAQGALNDFVATINGRALHRRDKRRILADPESLWELEIKPERLLPVNPCQATVGPGETFAPTVTSALIPLADVDDAEIELMGPDTGSSLLSFNFGERSTIIKTDDIVKDRK